MEIPDYYGLFCSLLLFKVFRAHIKFQNFFSKIQNIFETVSTAGLTT